MKKASETFWNATTGVICKDCLHSLREYLLNKYVDIYAQRKVINFSKAFLKYLAQTRFDGRYEAFTLFLTVPKAFKERKHVTSRIVTKGDIEYLLSAIEDAHQNEQIDDRHYQNYRAIVLSGAFTGQRPQATIARLSVGQFRNAVGQKKPVLDILPEQDKIRMQHYCPLHPEVVEAIAPLPRERPDDEPMFNQLSFERWLKQHKVPLLHGSHHFVSGDLRKFCEQMGDILEWDQSNKNYILTHSVSGVDWRFYKHLLPEHVHHVHTNYWRAVQFDLFL